MRRIRVTGTAAPEVVWDRYARLDLWPTWAPQIRRVEADGPDLVRGRSGVVVGPAGLRVGFVVDDIDPAGRTWRWRARAAGVELALGHAVTALPRSAGPTGGRGTAADLWIDGPALVVAAYSPVARAALSRLVAPDHTPTHRDRDTRA